MTILIWTVIAFVSGSLPFSMWVGRLALRTDIRQYGDHNPGATNVVRAGGVGWGVLAAGLDMLKGGLPVGLAWYGAGLSEWGLVPVTLAPILGHAFSPFLYFRGGKAVAVSGGVWGGLSYGLMTAMMAMLLLIWYTLLEVEGWAVALCLTTALVGFVLAGVQPSLVGICAGNLLILIWTHRADLTKPPALRPWIRKVVS